MRNLKKYEKKDDEGRSKKPKEKKAKKDKSGNGEKDPDTVTKPKKRSRASTADGCGKKPKKWILNLADWSGQFQCEE